MAKKKKELVASAPWRGLEEEDNSEKFSDANMKVVKQPGSEATMYVPGKKSPKSNNNESLSEIDQEFKYSFKRNYQFLQRVFTMDTLVKPLPPIMAYNVSRNLSFFTSIFTQFFDPKGIQNAQKSLGLGQEEKVRNVR
ncbi:zinc finger/BTB domain protein [Thalictrum thalictroides]|uniref:Zinc finger/BTB domain protein n=1 Tax=Thalictrum thalictroides TaxID=46969 RepID=A0A7J6W5D3_THATH|nr:zinc finger/BTB domain protein [Thalictrum thalictroides]